MSIWASHASPTELCLRLPSQSPQCRELSWLPTHSAEIVCQNALYAYAGALLTQSCIYSSISNVSSTRSKIGREEIKWGELLSHFRTVQNKHEKARRQALGSSSTDDFTPLRNFPSGPTERSAGSATVNGTARPAIRRRVTGAGQDQAPAPARPPSRALSPLNPRARGQSTLSTVVPPVPPSPTFAQGQGRGSVNAQPKRTLSLNRKS